MRVEGDEEEQEAGRRPSRVSDVGNFMSLVIGFLYILDDYFSTFFIFSSNKLFQSTMVARKTLRRKKKAKAVDEVSIDLSQTEVKISSLRSFFADLFSFLTQITVYSCPSL